MKTEYIFSNQNYL